MIAALIQLKKFMHSSLKKFAFAAVLQLLTTSQLKQLELTDLNAVPKKLYSKDLFDLFCKKWSSRYNDGNTSISKIWYCMLDIIWKDFIWCAGLLYLAGDILELLGPILIERVINYAAIGDYYMILKFSLLMFANSIIQSLCVQHYIDVAFTCGTQLSSVVSSIVFYYSLSIHMESSPNKGISRCPTVGEVIFYYRHLLLSIIHAYTLRIYLLYIHRLIIHSLKMRHRCVNLFVLHIICGHHHYS
jgi:hypothetical protein